MLRNSACWWNGWAERPGIALSSHQDRFEDGISCCRGAKSNRTRIGLKWGIIFFCVTSFLMDSILKQVIRFFVRSQKNCFELNFLTYHFPEMHFPLLFCSKTTFEWNKVCILSRNCNVSAWSKYILKLIAPNIECSM